MPRLEPTRRTMKRLYARSGNQCAFPTCSYHLFLDDNEENISQVCHIEAAEEKGQRYNPKSTDEYRRSYDNLIILCPTHHKITDDAEHYSVDRLREIKAAHEENVDQKMMEDKPSMLLEAICALAAVDWDSEPQLESLEFFSIDKKISYNNILRWYPRINAYKKYQGKIDSIYDQLEKSGNSFKKTKLLNLIQGLYLIAKGEWIEQIHTTKEKSIHKLNADNILDDVEDKLLGKIKTDSDNMMIAIPIIMVDAFMRCKILEEPPLGIVHN